MSQSALSDRLRKITAKLPVLQGRSEEAPKSSTSEPATVAVRSMLQILTRDPWDDYEYIRHLGQDMIASSKLSCSQLVNIRRCHSSTDLEQCRVLSRIQHPNIANVCYIYCHNDEAFLIMEYMCVSISQLDFQRYELKEWEIATIIAEVLNGVSYLSSLRLSCKDLSTENVRLTLDGKIKVVLDLQNLQHVHESSKQSEVLLDFPILAEIIEEMMLSRYHLTPDDDKWSDAVSFLSCTLSGSLEDLMNIPKEIDPADSFRL